MTVGKTTVQIIKKSRMAASIISAYKKKQQGLTKIEIKDNLQASGDGRAARNLRRRGGSLVPARLQTRPDEHTSTRTAKNYIRGTSRDEIAEQQVPRYPPYGHGFHPRQRVPA